MVGVGVGVGVGEYDGEGVGVRREVPVIDSKSALSANCSGVQSFEMSYRRALSLEF